MDYFPAFLDLGGRACLVVGAGDVALRKARLLLSAGADVTVIAPAMSRSFARFAKQHKLDYEPRSFVDGDVAGIWLVVSATGRPGVDRAVFEAASAAGVFCNAVDDSEHCSYITPAIVDRSPVVVAVSSGGAAPVLARQLRAKIETLLPIDLGRLARLAGLWRERVAARIDNLRARRRFWEGVFDGSVADLALGGNFEGAEQEMARLLAQTDIAPAATGEAWLVGAGPGDPGLLTLRALQVMQIADVILHDRLVSDEVLALARRDADLVPVGKSPGCRANTQEAINELLVALVQSGKRVCRLKGGDPFIFGRGGEELHVLRAAGLPCEVVPGITAAAGCAAYAGIPLTHRDIAQSVVFVAAHGKDSVDRLDWPSLARDRQTLAFYMAVRRFADLMSKLIEYGRPPDTPIAIVERGTRPDARLVKGRLGQLALLAEAQRIVTPAMLFVGDVAGLGRAANTERVSLPDPQDTRGGVICAKQGT